MVRTHGLTHVALAVRDAERSLRCYQEVFGVVPVYRQSRFIQAQTPGARNVLVFEEGAPRVGEPFVLVGDPDGYEVEIWHELPTPADPPVTER